MLHRAPFGSLERFIGVLIEHCGGNFPAWLAPVQVQVLPVGQSFNEYALSVTGELKNAGLRAECDLRHEKIGYKIRSAEMQKVPYMLVVGERELDSGTVALRRHGAGDQGSFTVEAFVASAKLEISEATGAS